ncbi:MAG: hypothetical protein ACLFPE_10285 [Bacteroidales bacterium]
MTTNDAKQITPKVNDSEEWRSQSTTTTTTITTRFAGAQRGEQPQPLTTTHNLSLPEFSFLAIFPHNTIFAGNFPENFRDHVKRKHFERW